MYNRNISAWFGSLTALLRTTTWKSRIWVFNSRKKIEQKQIFPLNFVEMSLCRLFMTPKNRERENESILHFDWIFMLMQLYVLWWMCYRMAIFPFLLHHIHTDDWNIYRWIWSTWYQQLATFNLSTSQMAMIDWFPNESTLRKILTQKSQRKKRISNSVHLNRMQK